MGRASRRKREIRNGTWTPPARELERQIFSSGISMTQEGRYVGPKRGVRKLSECLLELMTPWNPPSLDFEDFEALATTAGTAWMFAVLGDSREEIERRVHDHHPSAGEDLLPMILAMVERKNDLFPDDQRMPMKIMASRLGKDFHLQVASVS